MHGGREGEDVFNKVKQNRPAVIFNLPIHKMVRPHTKTASRNDIERVGGNVWDLRHRLAEFQCMQQQTMLVLSHQIQYGAQEDDFLLSYFRHLKALDKDQTLQDVLSLLCKRSAESVERAACIVTRLVAHMPPRIDRASAVRALWDEGRFMRIALDLFTTP